ncbi:MAG: HNH endonuclease [Peptostreptococcus sp.]|uniref:HNH endonuclease n=1 Tax=Peptostreptococcus sp. TaxID=1262 RepID=UPI0029009B9F|nr:HNH endonuclease [Peptostreptococcus sp.]MDU1264546.1 HNH endonuclease [Peptostreptococcus sp.]
MMLTKLCRCGAKVPVGEVCKVCGYDRHKAYDKQVRDEKTKKFYKSTQWTSLAKQTRYRYHNLDVYQLYKYNRLVPSEMVHHIIPVRDDWSKRLDPDYLIPLSNQSHAEIEREYDKGHEFKEVKARELLSFLEKFREGY